MGGSNKTVTSFLAPQFLSVVHFLAQTMRVCIDRWLFAAVLLTTCLGAQLRGIGSANETIVVANGQHQSDTSPLQHKSVLRKATQAAFQGGFYAASAGLVQVLTLMWLRTTVNYQYRYGVTMVKALQELYRQGGIGRFYRGLMFALIIGPLSKFGSIAANEWSKVMVSSLNVMPGAAETYATVLGTMLTVIWRVALMPIETCKTVLQVDGGSGFQKLINSVSSGNINVLYQGSTAAILSIAASHYPWFFVYNLLDSYLHKPVDLLQTIGRSAFMGFLASVVSDSVSNVLRVLKTVKQATGADGRRTLSYLSIAQNIMREGGVVALLGRGLLTRVLTNGLQSVLFTVLWKVLPLLWQKAREQQESNTIPQ